VGTAPFVPGKKGEYPEALETLRTTKTGLPIVLRPVKISDETLIKDFFYSLSDQSLYRRFISTRRDMPHERLQEFVIIDYTQEMLILATTGSEEQEKVVGIGQYGIGQDVHSAEVAFAVRDSEQKQGIGTELLTYLVYLGKRNGLLAFTAEVLYENRPMLSIFDKAGFQIVSSGGGVYYLNLNL
jgi:RimJ/RimL family protein N-acetyltransferase